MNPYAIIAVLVIWIGSLAGVGYWQNAAGHTSERTVWQGKENTELTDAANRILELSNKARTEVQKHADDLARISTQYQKEKTDAKRKTDALVAGLRAGTVILFDPGTSTVQTCGGAIGQTPSTTSGHDGGAPSKLSGAASEFLLQLTGESDEIVRQLSACQAVVLSDRAVVNLHTYP